MAISQVLPTSWLLPWSVPLPGTADLFFLFLSTSLLLSRGPGSASGEADPQVPVLDPFLSQCLSTLWWAGTATTVSSVPVQLCSTQGACSGSTRLQGEPPFLGLWPSLEPFVNKEEKTQFCLWGVFRCVRFTCEAARPQAWGLGPTEMPPFSWGDKEGVLKQTEGTQ